MAPASPLGNQLFFLPFRNRNSSRIAPRNGCDLGGWNCIDEGGQAGIIIVSISVVVILSVVVYVLWIRNTKKEKSVHDSSAPSGGIAGFLARFASGIEKRDTDSPPITPGALAKLNSPATKIGKTDTPDQKSEKTQKASEAKAPKKEVPPVTKSTLRDEASYVCLDQTWQVNDGPKNAKGHSNLRVKSSGVYRDMPNKHYSTWKFIDADDLQDIKLCQLCDAPVKTFILFRGKSLCEECRNTFGGDTEPIPKNRQHKSRIHKQPKGEKGVGKKGTDSSAAPEPVKNPDEKNSGKKKDKKEEENGDGEADGAKQKEEKQAKTKDNEKDGENKGTPKDKDKKGKGKEKAEDSTGHTKTPSKQEEEPSKSNATDSQIDNHDRIKRGHLDQIFKERRDGGGSFFFPSGYPSYNDNDGFTSSEDDESYAPPPIRKQNGPATKHRSSSPIQETPSSPAKSSTTEEYSKHHRSSCHGCDNKSFSRSSSSSSLAPDPIDTRSHSVPTQRAQGSRSSSTNSFRHLDQPIPYCHPIKRNRFGTLSYSQGDK